MRYGGIIYSHTRIYIEEQVSRNIVHKDTDWILSLCAVEDEDQVPKGESVGPECKGHGANKYNTLGYTIYGESK